MEKGWRSVAGRTCACAIGILAGCGAAYYQVGLDLRHPPVLSVPASRRTTNPGRAERVVWVLVDGLRLDASRRMPVLDRLRTAGLDAIGASEFPTYTVPNLVAQASGIEPRGSGVRSDDYPWPVHLDSVFRAIRMSGRGTAAVSASVTDGGVSRLYGRWLGATRSVGRIGRLPPGDLVFVYLGEPDTVAHAHGAASREYARAVRRADTTIRAITRRLNPTRDTLVVTSDHGHLDAGGHGGTEREVVQIPIVLWGAGIQAGRIAHAAARDVGPTIAALLGIGPLRHATGRSLIGKDAAAVRQRIVARHAVASAETMPSRPSAVFVLGMAGLLGLAVAGRGVHPRATSALYTLVFSSLAWTTRTLSFSIANDDLHFGMRLLAFGILAVLIQLSVDRRRSLIPAALVASVAALVAIALGCPGGARLAPAAECFLPIPALAGLSFVCLAAAALPAGP